MKATCLPSAFLLTVENKVKLKNLWMFLSKKCPNPSSKRRDFESNSCSKSLKYRLFERLLVVFLTVHGQKNGKKEWARSRYSYGWMIWSFFHMRMRSTPTFYMIPISSSSSTPLGLYSKLYVFRLWKNHSKSRTWPRNRRNFCRDGSDDDESS